MTSPYRDPMKVRLSMVDDLKPSQWAGMLATVASAAERQGWAPDEAREMLAMLGMDAKAARDAKAALRRSARLRLIYASAPTPKALPRPRTGQLGARVGHRRDRGGRFANQEMCARGLHPNVPENRITRPDRTTTQCRPCSQTRKRADRARRKAAA